MEPYPASCIILEKLSIKPTLTGALIGEEFVSFLTAALETPNRVPAEMIATSIILQTLVDVCKIERERDDGEKTKPL